MTDLIAGHIPVMFVSNISALPHVKSGKVKGVTGCYAEKTTPLTHRALSTALHFATSAR